MSKQKTSFLKPRANALEKVKHGTRFKRQRKIKNPAPPVYEYYQPVYAKESERLFCALSITTTGPNPFKHELFVIRAIATDAAFVPIPGLLPFSTVIRPRNPETFMTASKAHAEYGYEGPTAKEFKIACDSGIPSEAALTAFFNWSQKAFSPDMKYPRFVPIVKNWGRTSPFLLKFFGWKSDYTPAVCDIFDTGDVRDLSTIVGYYSELFNLDYDPIRLSRLIKSEDGTPQTAIARKEKTNTYKKTISSPYLAFDRKTNISNLNLDYLCDYFNVSRVSQSNAYYEPLAILRTYPLLLNTLHCLELT